MPFLVNKPQPIRAGVQYPTAGYSRTFGLACKAAAGIGDSDFAYSPPLGTPFWLLGVGIWFGSEDPAQNTGGTIYIATGTGIPVAGQIATQWELVIPFWAGTTKPAIMVRGANQFLWFPMTRLYKAEALRFGMTIENGYAEGTFWVNSWFEISEG
ncbi:hypothetical protein ES707_14764 [subsurface metagenome]